MEERQIGATELRQRLTDVIQAIKEENVAYVVETFGRPQVVIVDMETYRRLQAMRREGSSLDGLAPAAFGMWRDREDIDDEWLTRSRERWESAWEDADRGDG